jgi:prefoldin alpha subunit
MPKDKTEEMAISSQEELQQSLMYLEYMKEQITGLTEQLEVLELAIKEHNQAIETLKDFENLDNKSEILVPIGADSLVFAKVADASKVILNIGSGLAKEEKLDTAVKTLESRIDKIEESKGKIQETMTNLTQQATMLNSAIEEKYKEIQSSKDAENILRPPNVS